MPIPSPSAAKQTRFPRLTTETGKIPSPRLATPYFIAFVTNSLTMIPNIRTRRQEQDRYLTAFHHLRGGLCAVGTGTVDETSAPDRLPSSGQKQFQSVFRRWSHGRPYTPVVRVDLINIVGFLGYWVTLNSKASTRFPSEVFIRKSFLIRAYTISPPLTILATAE